jgi:hypothetical protein
MRRPAIPATMRDEVTDIQPLKCAGCAKVIFNTATCIMVKDTLYCAEWCADLAAVRRLRRSGRALPH